MKKKSIEVHFTAYQIRQIQSKAQKLREGDASGPRGWWKGSALTLKLGEKGPDSVVCLSVVAGPSDPLSLAHVDFSYGSVDKVNVSLTRSPHMLWTGVPVTSVESIC